MIASGLARTGARVKKIGNLQMIKFRKQ